MMFLLLGILAGCVGGYWAGVAVENARRDRLDAVRQKYMPYTDVPVPGAYDEKHQEWIDAAWHRLHPR